MTSFEKLLSSKKAQFVALGLNKKEYELYCEKYGSSIEDIVTGIDNEYLSGMYCICPLINETDGIAIMSLLWNISDFIPGLWFKSDTVKLNEPFFDLGKLNDNKEKR